MANLRVSIIEKVKQADGAWTNVAVKIPRSKAGNKGLYLKDNRDGKFYLLWREGKRRVYHPVEGCLSQAIRAKEQKETYLASLAAGLRVERPDPGRGPADGRPRHRRILGEHDGAGQHGRKLHA